MKKYFFHNWTHEGDLKTKVFSVIPFVLYFSKSTIESKTGKSGANVYAIHITPWVELGFNWRAW